MKKMVGIVAVAVLVGMLFGCVSDGSKEVSEIELFLIDDCEGETEIVWFTYDDAPDGGSSVVLPDPFELQYAEGQGADGSNGWAKMHGHVTTDFQYGFAGFGLNFLEDEEELDITEYSGIILSVRGDGKPYKVFVKDNLIKDHCYFGFQFNTSDEWVEIKIPFRFMLQETWGDPVRRNSAFARATGLQFQTRGQPLDSFELHVDNIYFYKD